MPSRLGGLLPSRSSSSHQVHSQSPLVGGGSFRDKHPTSSASYSSSSGSTALPARNDNDFAALWRDALDEFYRLTGEDIRDENSGLYEWLKGCSDYASVMESLEKQALAFRAYRQGSPSALKMRSALRSVVRVIINVIDVGSEAAASKAVPGGKAMFVAIAVLLRTVQGISARFDALVALLEKFGSFLERLDLRMNAPFEPVSRILAVKTLTEMLRTLAYAAQVMRHNRAKHFFDVLVGHGDDITDLTRRTEDLMREETRLSLAEVHKRMHNLSGSFVSALGRIEDNIAQLNEEMHTVSIGVNGALERLDNSGMHDLPRQFEAFVERYEEDRIDGGLESAIMINQRSVTSIGDNITVHASIISARLSRVESELQLLRNQPQAPSAIKTFTARVSVLCIDMTSSVYSAAGMLAGFHGMSPDEQAYLRQKIIALYAMAATAVIAGNVGNPVDAIVTGPVNATSVLAGLLPLAAVYLAVIVFWRQSVSRAQSGIPRAPDHVLADSIILIDAFGTYYVLQPERCKTWEDLHIFLLDQHKGRSGIEFIKSRAYRIMDTCGDESVINPQDWTNSVRTGMTLELSFAMRQMEYVCPWCRRYAPPDRSHGGWVQCQACTRRFWTSDVSIRKDSQSARTIHNDAPETARALYSSSDFRDQEPFEAGPHLDVMSCRRIVVVCDRHYECDYCGKGFRRPTSLKTHMKSHFGERPYRCTFRGCERTFSALSKMRRHAQFHDFTNAADVSEIADDDDVDLARSR